MSGDPKQEYFSDGITEQIIMGLSKVPKLFVIARTSSFKYKGRKVDVRTVGRELGVRYVLEGSVQKSGERLRITVQLIDAETTRIITEAEGKAEQLLQDNFDKLHAIAEALREYEILDGEEIDKILRGEKLDRPTVNKASGKDEQAAEKKEDESPDEKAAGAKLDAVG